MAETLDCRAPMAHSAAASVWVPTGADNPLTGEIKNVITAVAKPIHSGYLPAQVRQALRWMEHMRRWWR